MPRPALLQEANVMVVQSSANKPTLSAIASGALSGVIIFMAIILIDHFFFTSRETARYGLPTSLVSAGVLGAVFGAVVGSVLAMTRSMPAGILTGAVLFALVKVMVIGFIGAFTVAAIIFGLIYGAIFGWCVASSAAKAMEASG